MSLFHTRNKKEKNRDLLDAALHGWTHAIEEALREGAQIGTHDEEGLCPIHIAAANGHAEIVELLLDRGVAPSVRARQSGYTPLHCAARAEHADIVKLLLEAGANPNVSAQGGLMPLHSAVLAGNVEIAKTLLQAGAQLVARDEYGCDALIYAIISGELAMVTFLISEGLSFQYCNADHQSPFFYVHRNATTDIAKYLLELGADISGIYGEIDEGTYTTIDIAADHKNLSMVRFLAEHGAVPNKLQPLCLALENKWKDLVPSLIERSTVVDSKFEGCSSFLSSFVYDNNIYAIKTLVSCGIKFSCLCGFGTTVLESAIFQGKYKIVKILLDAGVDPNYCGPSSSFDSTPLMVAAREGRTDMVRLLLEHGADPERQKENGDTAHDLAVENKHRDCAALIREAMQASGTKGKVAVPFKRTISKNAPWNTQD